MPRMHNDLPNTIHTAYRTACLKKSIALQGKDVKMYGNHTTVLSS